MAAKGIGAAATVIISIIVLSLVGALLSMVPLREFFGAQGGEMVQLAAGHVPTMADLEDQKEEARQVQREIVSMTGYW
jgi:hypothetical protein